jgi:tRNA(Met) C34 N-acetyltransferase TmcA
VHERFRTESHTQAAARFNERFLLSVASCKACVVMDDELNILPISSHMKFVQPVTNNEVRLHQFSSIYWHVLQPQVVNFVEIWFSSLL